MRIYTLVPCASFVLVLFDSIQANERRCILRERREEKDASHNAAFCSAATINCDKGICVGFKKRRLVVAAAACLVKST
jgi:hypothetical protein